MRYLCSQLTLSVGVVGHRNIPPEQKRRMEGQVEAVLMRMKADLWRMTVTGEVWDGFDGEPVTRMVSCLTDGAERLAAAVAVLPGTEYELAAVLAFPRDSERHEFGENEKERRKSRKEFCRLLGKAVSVWEPGGGAEIRMQNAEMEEAARLRMLGHSDVLLAIWDGVEQETPGSTYDVISLAVKMGMPVIWIHSEAGEECQEAGNEWRVTGGRWLGDGCPVRIFVPGAEEWVALKENTLAGVLRGMFRKPEEEKPVSFDDFVGEKVSAGFHGTSGGGMRNGFTAFREDAERVAESYAGWKMWFSGRRRQKAAIYGELARRLRLCEALHDLGHGFLGLPAAEMKCRWSAWYVRNIVRQVGVPDVDLSANGKFESLKTELAEWILRENCPAELGERIRRAETPAEVEESAREAAFFMLARRDGRK